jgi:integrase/recombinase XerD
MKSLRIAIQEYLQLRCGLGSELRNARSMLKRFIRFMEEKRASYITTNLALEFATQNQHSLPVQRAAILGTIRQFARYWNTIDSRTQIPPLNIIPGSYHRRKPYIYSENEIIKLLECCKTMHSAHPLGTYIYFALFGLLAVTGMRIGEVLALKSESVDLKNGIINIRDTKSRQARYVPIHPSTVKVLQRYVKQKNQCFSKTSFFL